MFWGQFLFALCIALILTLLFVPTAGWRRGRYREGDAAAAILFFFLILFLASWTGGIWLAPFGPLAWGVPWLSFLLVALVVALILAAVPPYRGGRRRAVPATSPPAAEEAGEAIAAGLGIFFWALLVTLAIAIFLAYV
ncbi:MAG TPA: hypothetical protein VMS76_16805 [Planctomycetota bacterium]|nr:hypothetical protein [Planctomycetota bacterium]